MTHRHTIDLARMPVQAWKNGGGTTQQLLTWPQSAADEWSLRVSVARVDHPGAFSPYPGVVRGFVLLQGSGVRLALPQGPRTVEPGDEPLWFDGESAPHCELLEGPTLDLNFMVRRSRGVARFTRALPGSSIDGPTAWRGLFAWRPALLEIDGVTEPVHGGQLLWTDAVDASPWTLHPGRSTDAWWLSLET
jgi:environmental stress-induced protein Ves